MKYVMNNPYYKVKTLLSEVWFIVVFQTNDEKEDRYSISFHISWQS